MRPHFVVLGAGRTGAFIARKLAGLGERVTLVDRSESALERATGLAALTARAANLADQDALAQAVADADVVVGALPGGIGFEVLHSVIAAGKSMVDISFFPEDPFRLDEQAKARGVRAVVDCGVMPGLGGMLAAHLAGLLDEPESLAIYVGGLPVERTWPLEYHAPFSPSDVIEEYVRPARLKRCGTVIDLPALSEVEQVHVLSVGTLEAFLTDGLRTLLRTLPFPNMVEKTLRYPGHAEKMRMLRELGFFSLLPTRIGEHEVRPRDMAVRLLEQAWQGQAWREFTYLRVVAEGTSKGERQIYEASGLNWTEDDDSSMSRCTGWPAVMAARMLSAGELDALGPGIIPAEAIGADPRLMRLMLAGLASAGLGFVAP
jgi:saccharopine dehydrogenase-like NADP-dependent oxidoreductase